MTNYNSIRQQVIREMNRAKRRWWDNPPELPKDHEAVPDVDLGLFYRRQDDGSLQIFLKGTHLTLQSTYVVLGKYAEPKPDGALYYVSRRAGYWGDKVEVYYCDHLVAAVAKVMELKELFDGGSEPHWDRSR